MNVDLNHLISAKANQEEVKALHEVLRDIPTLVQRIDGCVGVARPGSMQEWAQGTPLARHAYDFAMMGLDASRDALLTLFALVIRGKTIPALAGFTLCRQAAENAALAAWCLEFPDAMYLSVRGFAVALKNMDESVEYAKARGDEEGITLSLEGRRDLLEAGHSQGLLDPTGKPEVTQPGWTRLFKDIPFNAGNLEWFYRGLSGASHGRVWAKLSFSVKREILSYVKTSPDGSQVSSDMVLIETGPNLPLLGDSLFITKFLTLRAVQRFEQARSVPAPV